jgi:hypothetical protein
MVKVLLPPPPPAVDIVFQLRLAEPFEKLTLFWYLVAVPV